MDAISLLQTQQGSHGSKPSFLKTQGFIGVFKILLYSRDKIVRLAERYDWGTASSD